MSSRLAPVFLWSLSVLLLICLFTLSDNRIWASSSQAAPGIQKNSPAMRLEGQHTFMATPSTAGTSIQWTVDRLVNETVQNTVYTATGIHATFNLTWIDGNTTYIIKASDNSFNDELKVQVFPPDKGVSYIFKNPYRQSPDVSIQVQIPSDLDQNTPLISVHHGVSRSNYFSYWTEWGKKHKWIILAPHFPDSNQWAGSRGYSLGNMFTKSNGRGQLNPEAQWSYRIAVDAAVALLEGFDLYDKSYDIWGHSAGGQFTHRTALFIRDAPIRRCLPANPGWWTLPVYHKTDKNFLFPYGIYHPELDYDETDLLRFFNTPGVINAGNLDTERDSNLRTTPEADAQGANRWLRANNMFRVITEQNPDNKWFFLEVEGVGHSGRMMAQAAQEWLVANPPVRVPIAIFTAMPMEGNSPLDVAFDATASDANEGEAIVAYLWEFGDGDTAMGEITSHRYESPGTYTATLTITNAAGKSNTSTTVISVWNPSQKLAAPRQLKVIESIH